MAYGANEKHFRGYMVAYLGDTPAAALAGGFKEGVGGAHSCCRACMIKSKDLCVQVRKFILHVPVLKLS